MKRLDNLRRQTLPSAAIGVLAVSCMAALALPLTASPAAESGLGTTTFRDASGDARGSAPDITGVTVTASRSNVVWKIDAASSDPNESILKVFIDTDNDCKTGRGCADIYIEANGPSERLESYVFKNSLWVMSSVKSLPFATTGWPSTIAWSPSKRLSASRLPFWIEGYDFDEVQHDDAPSKARWVVPLGTGGGSAPAATRTVKTWTSSDGQRGQPPTVGEQFIYAASFAYRTTGKPVSAGAPTCAATAQASTGKPVSVTVDGAFAAKIDGKPAFICRLAAIPARLAGRVIRVRLAVKGASGREIAATTLVARIR